MTYVATKTKVWWFSLVPLVPYDAICIFKAVDLVVEISILKFSFKPWILPRCQWFRAPSCPSFSYETAMSKHNQTTGTVEESSIDLKKEKYILLQWQPDLLYIYLISHFSVHRQGSRSENSSITKWVFLLLKSGCWGTLLHQHALVAHWLQASP